MADLDSFLTSSVTESEPVETPEPTLAVETAAPAVEGVESATPAPQLPPRGEDGKWIKRDEAAPQTPQSHQVPLEALLAEREKRQAAERALTEKAQAEPKPDFWANPEAAVKAELGVERERMREEVRQLATSEARSLFLQYTEEEARGRYADYDAMRGVFAEAASRNPVLAAQLREASNPAEFIYRQGRTAAELREVGGDLGAYRKKLEAELRAKIEAEMGAKPRAAVPPPSLNTEPSKGAGIVGSPHWAGPTPLEDILPNRRA
jgi:hypothetical protein